MTGVTVSLLPTHILSGPTSWGNLTLCETGRSLEFFLDLRLINALAKRRASRETGSVE